MKDYIRDYATAAFRFYAVNGKNTEEFKEKIKQEAIETVVKRQGMKSSGVSPTEGELIRAENAVIEKIASIMDMEAVDKTLAELKVNRRHDIVKAIQMVYFDDCNQELDKGFIQTKVQFASIALEVSERTVYNYLKKARILFAYSRGLRL